MNTLKKLTLTAFIAVAGCLTTLESNAQTGDCTGGLPHTKNKKWVIMTYGLPDHKWPARHLVADRWGIEFQMIAGCIVDNEITTRAQTNNDSVYPLIEAKYGKDWSEKFDKEVDEENKRMRKVDEIVRGLDYVMKKQDKLVKEGGEYGNYFYYKLVPVANTTRYNVYAQAWEGKAQKQWTTYYNLLVDYKTGKVKIISDKPEADTDGRYN